MCGIAGVIGFSPNKEKISKCLDGLKRRGPDDYGVFLEKDFLIIHTRLAIIDLTDNAKQPMIHKQTGVVLAFNGEIYNFRELKKKYNLSTSIKSDTRVILEIYLKKGIEVVSELHGMFAICIWDPRDQTTHLIRDRFGIKPLYLYRQYEKFIFGSDLNSIFNLGAERNPNLNSIKKYLNYGITENNKDTFFKNIEPIPTGSILSIKSNKISIKKYWDLKKTILNKKNTKVNQEDLLGYVEENIKKSINSHLVSDVPIGLTLSSGLDSTIILNYLLENKNLSKLKTFTYGYYENIYDESKKIQQIFQDNKIDSHISKLKKTDLVSELKEAVTYFQSPVGGLGTLSLFNLMKEVKKNNINVILSGEGADEIFAGYKYYFYALLLDLKYKNEYDKIKNELKFWKSLTGEDLSNVIRNDKILSEMAFGMKAPDGTSLKSFNFEGDLLKGASDDTNLNMKNDKDNNLMNLRYEDIFVKKLPKLLMFQDRCSMFSSIESRVPFLDHNLVEKIFILDPSCLIQNAELKNLLRVDIQKFKFNKINKNQKEFVATPQREWLKKDLFKEIFSEIMDSNLDRSGLINLKSFELEYKKYSQSSELGNSFFVWKLLNLKFMFS